MENRLFLKWPLVAVLSALSVTTAVAQPDELPASGVIPGRYIVVLRPGSDRAAIAARHAVVPDQVYSRALNGFAGFIPPARLAQLQGDPDVAWIEPDQVATINGKPAKPPPPQPAQTIPTGVLRIGLDTAEAIAGAAEAIATAGDVGVAIIDTGIDLDHPDLNVVGNVSFVFRARSGDDDNGHGTHVAGTAAASDNEIGVVGVAPGAPLYAVKVLDRRGSGAYSWVIAGVDWVAENAGVVKVANMSLSGPFSDALNSAVSSAVGAGVVFCVAAGNESVDAQEKSPASCEDAITVSAIDAADGACGGDVFASFSNWGPAVDIAAPGVDIFSTYKGGTYAVGSGTSMATPHATGAAALYIATHAGSLPADVCDGLIDAGWLQTDECGFSADPDDFSERLLHVAW